MRPPIEIERPPIKIERPPGEILSSPIKILALVYGRKNLRFLAGKNA